MDNIQAHSLTFVRITREARAIRAAPIAPFKESLEKLSTTIGRGMATKSEFQRK